MENLTKQTHLLISAISCFVCLSLLSTTVKGDVGFNYDPCSERGPMHWGELKTEWAECKNGRIQSPIPLSMWTSELNQDLGFLKRDHRPATANLKIKDYEVVVEWIEDAGSININNTDYHLANYHWHIPSEHTQDGKTFPLELHMVHLNNNSNVSHNIAVIGVLFEYGPPDPFIYKIETDLKHLEGGNIFLGEIDPNVATLGTKYFRYMGSLTTPPCTEGVIWTVMKKVQTVAPYQIGLLKQASVGKNARPLQNINGRDVFYFDPFRRGSAAE